MSETYRTSVSRSSGRGAFTRRSTEASPREPGPSSTRGDLLAIAGLCVSFVLFGTSWLHAATLVVDRFGDSATHTQCSDAIDEDCSLRGAIITANQWPGEDTIEFDLPYTPPFFLRTIYLSLTGTNENNCQLGDLDITDAVIIDGGGWVEIDASQLGDRVVEVHDDVNGEVVLRGLKVQGGGGVEMGGGFALRWGSTLVLENCEVRDNSCNLGGSGGWVSPGGQLWIFTSTLTGNHGTSTLEVRGQAHISDSTISGNTGAAIVTPFATLLWLHHSTIAANALGSDNHAIYLGEDLVFDVSASIIEGACWKDPASVISVISAGGTIESPGNTCGLDPIRDLVNVADTGLWPLDYYGGVTPTQVPNPGSTAVDDPRGSITICLGDDQRGLPRYVDGNGDRIDGCDSGAVERQIDEAALLYDGFETGTTSRW